MTIDTHQTPAPRAEVTPPTSKPPKPRRSIAGWVAFIILLLALIAAAAFLWFFWQGYQQKQTQQQAALQKEIQTLQANWINSQAQLSNQNHQLDLIQESLKQFQKENWPLAQAQYLVKLAAYNLAFENNPELAVQILKAADTQLQAGNDPALLPVRQALATDIADLNAVSKVDIGGVVSTLNAVSQQIEKLPTRPAPAVKEAQKLTVTAPAPTAAQWSTWKTWFYTFGEDVWRVLKSMIVIHHNKPEAAPLLPPDQYVYVITNIQSQLALAQWAVLHQRSDIYQQSLRQAADWINRYFPANEPAVAAVLKQVQTLSQITVKPETPDLSRSLQAITQAMDKAQ